MKKKLVVLAGVTPLLIQSVTFAQANPGIQQTDSTDVSTCGDHGPLHNALGYLARKTGLDLNIDVLNTTLFGLVGVGTRYSKVVDRVAATDVYVRRDIYRAKLGIYSDLLDTSNPLNTHGNLALGASRAFPVSLEYNRFSKDVCGIEALKPIELKSLPIDSARALKMNTADYFKLDASSVMELAPDLLTYLGGSSVFGVNVSAGAKLQFSYQVHVVRLENNKVLLRLLGLRLPQWEQSMSLGVMSPLKFTGVKLVDKQITRRFDVDLLTVQHTVTPKKLDEKTNLMEFEIDLSDAKVKTAYDSLLGNFTEMVKINDWKKLGILNPFGAFKRFQVLSENVSKDLVTLAATDPKAVQKSTDFETENRHNETDAIIGMVFGRFRSRKIENSLDLQDNGDANKQNYHVTNFRQLRDSSFIYSLARQTNDQNMDVVYKTSGQAMGLDQMVFTTERADTNTSKTEVIEFLKQVQRNVHPDFYAAAEKQIQQTWFNNDPNYANLSFFQKLGLDKAAFQAANLYYQVVVTPDVLKNARKFNSVMEAKVFLAEYLKRLQDKGIGLTTMRIDRDNSGSVKKLVVDASDDGAALDEAANALYKILDPSLSDKEKDKILASLSDNAIFLRAGSGIIAALLGDMPIDQVKKMIGYKIVLRSTKLTKPLEISWQGAVTAPSEIATKMIEIRSFTQMDDKDLEIVAAKLIKN